MTIEIVRTNFIQPRSHPVLSKVYHRNFGLTFWSKISSPVKKITIFSVMAIRIEIQLLWTSSVPFFIFSIGHIPHVIISLCGYQLYKKQLSIHEKLA